MLQWLFFVVKNIYHVYSVSIKSKVPDLFDLFYDTTDNKTMKATNGIKMTKLDTRINDLLNSVFFMLK